MNITGLTFFIFLLITWASYYICPKKYRWTILLSGSIVFYLFFGFKAIIFLSTTVIATYLFGILLEKKQCKLYVALPLVVNFGILAVLKYSGFILKTAESIIGGSLDFSHSQITENMIIPLGISFYTFQSAAYLIDIYRGNINSEHNFAKFSLYIMFFPHIIQGPIARYDALAPQLYEGHDFDYDKNVKGVLLILWGTIKKLIIAEHVGLIVNGIFDSSNYNTTLFVIAGGILYAIQLYTDFSGYMNIVIGVANLFGISLMQNFDTPYFSKNISEFWRRWHISLSSWLRDYIYIPLGGNRKGTLRKCVNVMVIFLVSGIWHGAAWTFVVWGFYHGIISVINNFTLPLGKKIRFKLNIKETSFICCAYQMITTGLLVSFGWIFFRANSLTSTFNMIKGLFNFGTSGISDIVQTARVLCRDNGLSEYKGIILLLFLVVFIAVEILNYKKISVSDKITKLPFPVRLIIVVFTMLLIVWFGSSGQGSFMYANF